MTLIEVTKWKVVEIEKYQLKLTARGYGNFNISSVVNGRIKYLMTFEKVN